jgi:S1-C subfamily serine protease
MNIRVILAASVLIPAVVSAQTPEERTGARNLIAKYGDAVVTVLGTAKVRISQGGREVQNRDERVQATATMLDASGLAVMSLAAVDPSDVLMANAARANRPGAPALTVSVESSDLRFRMADGKEVPARVVLRDKDLDLAFLRPVEKFAAPVTALETTSAKPLAVDLLVVVQRLPEIANWQATATFATVQAVVEKPRTFYVVNTGAFGAPVFDTGGRFVGVVLRLRNDTGEGPTSPPVVLPANDIREVAKQAT